ncbi:glycosyltransferase family 4 protein [Melioribacter sp. Ez-97]|uniref:glycosyltransferase family 4 protein n=1 Tax=Melioribacter sp. Ez-97 TaxID=3423434 RepID=UPI003ED860D4
MKTKTFLTFFPGYEDFHFWKDPGQIPFRFMRLGYKSKILTRKSGDFLISKKYLDVEILEVKLFLGKDISTISYFLKQGKNIDILNIFHLHCFESLLAAYIYKLRNPKGFVYLKMDNCHSSGIYPWEKIFDKKVVPVSFLAKPNETFKWRIKKFLIKNLFIKKIDLFSVEDEESRKYFENKYSFFRNKIIVAYNGHTVDFVQSNIKVNSFEEKENLIITVGRLGTFQKNTLNLLKGFAETAKQHNWNLELAGPIVPDFSAEINNFMVLHPELSKRIKFLGNLDKPELYNLYNRAKIFLLPSRFEGFAIAYSEAAYFANAIITSPYTSISNILIKEEFSVLVAPEKPEEIGQALLRLINNPAQLQKYCSNSKKFAENNLNWNEIVKKIDKRIMKRFYK